MPGRVAVPAMCISASDRSLVGRDRAAGYGNRIALGVMLTGIFITVMDGSIVNVAIHSIRTTVGTSFAEGKERTAAFVVTGVVIGLANVSGLIAGGMLLQADILGLALRPVFLVNVPVGVISVIVGPFVLPRTGTLTSRGLDAPGVLLSALGLGMLMYSPIDVAEQ